MFMKAQELRVVTDLHQNPEPLVFCEREIPAPEPDEILVRVRACGVCHTELDEIEGRTPPGTFPIIPGHLWLENEIKSVANVCRSDERAFLQLAAELDIRPQVEVYPLKEANRALCDLKTGAVRGAKVLSVD